MENRAFHWLTALIVAALLHAAVALALVRAPPPQFARIITIAIELEPGGNGGAAGQASADTDGGGGKPAGDEAEDARIEQPSDARDEREPEPIQVPGSLVEPESEPEPERKPEPELEQEPRSESATEPTPTVEVVPPAPKPEPAVVGTPAPSPKVSEKPKPKPKVAKKPRVKPKPEVASKPKPRSSAERASAPKAAGESQTGAGRSGPVARSKGGGSGTGKESGSGKGKGGAKSRSRYYGKLAAWLNRHKRYPAAARRRRQTGTVRVTFTINRNGRVLSKRIVSSSGYAALDKEVEAMLRRASPMPKIPRELGRSTLTVTLPVIFNLR
jgi:protein TonB